MKLTQQQITIVVGGLALVLVISVAFYFLGGGKPADLSGSIVVWGVGDPQAAFDGLIGGYTALHPKVTIAYRSFDPGVYDATLLNALASGQGPDIFMVSNRSLTQQADKVLPADVKLFSLSKLRSLFPTVVEQDFATPQGVVLALPLSIDTLALIYNRSLLDQATIVAPPVTWNDFVNDVPKLRSVSVTGQITRAAAAIGGSLNTMGASVDLLQLLMLQNGAAMTDQSQTTATFASQGSAGVDAFKFYLQFANPTSPAYTWNDNQQNDLDAFSGQKVAMVFGYQDALAALKKKSPFLSIGVAQVPQVPQATGSGVVVSFARYYGLAVSRQSKVATLAWDFILSATTNQAIAQTYLDATGRPPALRSLIAAKSDDPALGVFARQALTARSWSEPDDGKITTIFNAAIRAATGGGADPGTILRQAEDQVTQLLRPRS
jgi:ABC-type glycerol-3-phosphate transport system substrate-binding protein